MSTQSFISMILLLLFVSGGFVIFLRLALKNESKKTRSEEE